LLIELNRYDLLLGSKRIA